MVKVSCNNETVEKRRIYCTTNISFTVCESDTTCPSVVLLQGLRNKKFDGIFLPFFEILGLLEINLRREDKSTFGLMQYFTVPWTSRITF